MAFSYYMPVTIDHTKVGAGTHTNFPVLVKKTSVNLKSTANSGHVTSDTGYDICFYSDTGLTTKLDHQLISYAPTTGALTAWVRMPAGTLPNETTDTTIYIGYGDESITTDQSTANTWDANYRAVWHGKSTADSKNTNTISLTNSTANNAGKIAGSLSSNGTSSVIDVADHATLDVDHAITISAWINFSSHTGNAGGIYYKNSTSLWQNDVRGMDFGYLAGTYYFLVMDASNNYYYRPYTGTPSDGTWYYVCGSWGGTSTNDCAFYMNGSASGSAASGSGTVSTARTNNETVRIGGKTKSGTEYAFNGFLEEIRLSDTVRSAGWVLTEYNNQNDPDAFVNLGTEQAVSSSGRTAVSSRTATGARAGASSRSGAASRTAV